MGQAFDEDGQLLGEAEGETRLEVLRKLEAKHANAARIEITRRLRELEQSGDPVAALLAEQFAAPRK